jgi:hypothetical protein
MERLSVTAGDATGGADDRVLAFWCRIPSRANFGDALTPWLTKQITGRYPRFVRHDDPRPKHLVTGSIIAYATRGTIVWGAGLHRRTDDISPHARLVAVRGPLTRARAIASGADCPEVLGDPALLLPRFRPAAPGPRRSIGVAPHFADMPRLAASWRPRSDVKLIDLQAPVEEVIDAITSCECILSSSLHAIIASHAYGIPAGWVKFRDLPSGDDSKFHDHHQAVGMDPPPPMCVGYDRLDVDALARRAALPARLDAEPLWRVCPLPRRA